MRGGWNLDALGKFFRRRRRRRRRRPPGVGGEGEFEGAKPPEDSQGGLGGGEAPPNTLQGFGARPGFGTRPGFGAVSYINPHHIVSYINRHHIVSYINLHHIVSYIIPHIDLLRNFMKICFFDESAPNPSSRPLNT